MVIYSLKIEDCHYSLINFVPFNCTCDAICFKITKDVNQNRTSIEPQKSNPEKGKEWMNFNHLGTSHCSITEKSVVHKNHQKGC
jgi:hypothetical protein